MTTQNCPECGTRAEPGQSFCDACGAVLSWTDRATARAGAAAGSGAAADSGSGSAAGASAGTGAGAGAGAGAATGPRAGAGSGGTGSAHGSAPEEAPQPPSGTPGPQATVGTAADPGPGAVSPTTPATTTATATAPADDDHDSDDEDTTETPLPAIPPEDGTAAPSTPAPTPPPNPNPGETAPTTPTPAPALGDTMAARARSLLVPVADAEPRPAAPPSVAPVLPGRPVADRPQVRAPGPVQGEQHGVACPWCATPNNPDRHFCVRCAMPMTLEDRSSIRLPWWRRLFNRNGETPWAGDRPRLRRTFDRIVSWLVAAVVLTLVIIAGVNTPDAIQATRDHFAKRAPVTPDSFAASRSYPGHKPELAFDKLNNTWWGPGVSQSGEGEWIEASFDQPTRLLDLIITSGTSIRPDQLDDSALPHRIKATITLKDGRTTTRELTLDQSAGGQRRAFRVGEVTKVRFTIESSYSVSGSKQVSIAEIEFFGPSSANAS
ncbi:zinc ribbon domain-containing protein [Streptomyces sp. NY05-11A]|uniref:zinc ribbon domain-containing protein n=1 Tax=Streptomyces soliscabiei TaxID=588897 RepID=UPI0029B57FC8|nr:zinc ribbon domain-containing protein [Streptomyces sp. NY05-11A]MDX2677330.1 zinc ribbon domain-containing protein [Streptomyces sp. NY05-11A]